MNVFCLFYLGPFFTLQELFLSRSLTTLSPKAGAKIETLFANRKMFFGD
jgi:hypothetical protein